MQAKKSLGQNFLSDPKILKKIVGVSGVGKNDTVLEIGPGLGTLTKEILATGANVIAVEKDHRLITPLTEKFAKEIANGKLKIIEGDILDSIPYHLLPKTYSLIANLPYYITGQALSTFLSAEHQPTSITLLLQKEVVERIVARDNRAYRQAGKESLLSLSVKVYGTPEKEFIVKAGSFNPAPKVDSAVITIKNISRKNFKSAGHEKKFFEMIHLGFAHKRKQLKNNLLDINLSHCGLDLKKRAEELLLNDWLCLSQ